MENKDKQMKQEGIEVTNNKDKAVAPNKTLIQLLFGVVLLMIAGFAYWYFTEYKGEKSMGESSFNELEDMEFSVVDDSYFEDEEMEKWYLENRQEPGEYIYTKDNQTYILLSLGVVDNPNTFLLLHGVKTDKDNELIVGYDEIVVDTETNLELQDDIRSTLITLSGKYETVKAVKVEEDETES